MARRLVAGASALPPLPATTMWRLVDDKIDAKHLPGIRTARAHLGMKHAAQAALGHIAEASPQA